MRMMGYLAVVCCLMPALALGRIKIMFWESMAGSLGTATNHIVEQFNHSQKQYQVIPVFKGNYNESLTSLVAAFRAKQQPAIAQVFEVGTAMMTHPKGIIIPVYQLMHMAHLTFNSHDFIPSIRDYYANAKGQLLGLPFNSSSAVLYYNKNEFIQAGLNPNRPPRTWPAVAADAKKLRKAGIRCGFTSTWPSWIQIETFSAWHNIPVATENNGMSDHHGLNARMLIDNPLVLKQLRHLVAWEKTGIFRYGGREDDAQSLFTSGVCAMMLQSSGARTELIKAAPFTVGTGYLPYWPDAKGAPQNTIIGGAALWAMSGISKKVDLGVARFFAFLSQPKIQMEWQQATGYVPVTQRAYQLSKQAGFYQKNPGAKIAIEELNHKPPKPYTRGVRLGNYPQIRDINDESIEAALTGQKTPKQALAFAVKRDNILLRQFQSNFVTSGRTH